MTWYDLSKELIKSNKEKKNYDIFSPIKFFYDLDRA